MKDVTSDDGDANRRTLDSYDGAADLYAQRTPDVVKGAFKEWLDDVRSRLAPGSSVLEIGTGTGRDALYMEQAGFDVTRTEASDGLLDRLRASGVVATKLNIVTDAITGSYELVYANAVFHHFTEAQFVDVLVKINRSLTPGGFLAFSVKEGSGNDWESEKLGMSRYFQRWSGEKLQAELVAVGYEVLQCRDHVLSDNGESWVDVIAQARRD